eukprot:Gb_40483 [translate_table: standard]
MGEWRLRASALLRSILSAHTLHLRALSSSTISLPQANKASLLETFNSYLLPSQERNFAERIQASWQVQFGIQPRLNFMGTVSSEATTPVFSEGTTIPVQEKEENGVVCEGKKLSIIFVLGGPGSGKGTQCAKIVENFGFTHLSAGDLLRAEIKSGSQNGTMIQNMIKEGKIVPSEVTVELLQRAMQESENEKFLIDGFPRNEENRAAFECVTGIEPEFILYFDCPEEEMERRLLNRNEGRVDDNIETIRKRFKVFVESSLPVISYYELKGKVRKIDAARTKEDIFEGIKLLFTPYIKETCEATAVDN